MREFETTVDLPGIGTVATHDYNLDAQDLQVEAFDSFLDQLVPDGVYDSNTRQEFRDKFGASIDNKYKSGEEVTLRGLIETMYEVENSIKNTETFHQTRSKIYANISDLALALVLGSNSDPESEQNSAIAKASAYFQAKVVLNNIEKLLGED